MKKWIIPVSPALKGQVLLYIKGAGMNISGFVELAIKEKLEKVKKAS